MKEFSFSDYAIDDNLSRHTWKAKRGGWHWEQTKMLAPARAERLWLAWAVAT